MAPSPKGSPNVRRTASDVPVPQNFIPGATKPVVKASPKTEKKYKTNLCYQGLHVALDKDTSINQRALLSAGLKAITVPAPTGHSDCTHIHDRGSSPLHLFQVCNSDNNNEARGRSVTCEPGANIQIDYSIRNVLPEKIKRKEFSKSKKWRSLETLHNNRL